jgi:hypothetical protein
VTESVDRRLVFELTGTKLNPDGTYKEEDEFLSPNDIDFEVTNPSQLDLNLIRKHKEKSLVDLR